jgi:pimeloyl-ACP methyl ester carboxylesterase
MNVKAANSHTPRTCTQPIGDAEISYLFYEGEGPALIFLHATGFLPWLWHPLARELAGRYRIFAPYFCDHREADPENGGFSWRTLAEDLALFCRNLNLETPFLVGHSMGATIATIANAMGLLPAAGMVLIEPIFLPAEFYRQKLTVSQHPFASKAIRRTNFWRNDEEAETYLHSRPLFADWDQEMVELYLQHGMRKDGEGLRLTCSPRREAALFMGGVRYDPWPLLAKVSCPVLVLEGEKSGSRGYIDFARICSLIPGCTRHKVAGAGHLIPMEQPREVTHQIREFLNSVAERKRDNDVQ